MIALSTRYYTVFSVSWLLLLWLPRAALHYMLTATSAHVFVSTHINIFTCNTNMTVVISSTILQSAARQDQRTSPLCGNRRIAPIWVSCHLFLSSSIYRSLLTFIIFYAWSFLTFLFPRLVLARIWSPRNVLCRDMPYVSSPFPSPAILHLLIWISAPIACDVQRFVLLCKTLLSRIVCYTATVPPWSLFTTDVSRFHTVKY